MYYSICPGCGASLDPGERCDCTREPEAAPAAAKRAGGAPSAPQPQPGGIVFSAHPTGDSSTRIEHSPVDVLALSY